MSRAHAPGWTFYSFPARMEREPDTFLFQSPWMAFEARARQPVAIDVHARQVAKTARLVALLDTLDVAARLRIIDADELREQIRSTFSLREDTMRPEPRNGVEIARRLEPEGHQCREVGTVRGQRRWRARPPIILQRRDVGAWWRHGRRRDLAPLLMADVDEIQRDTIELCATSTARLGPGALCGCGEYYAPTIQPRYSEHGDLVLYEVGPELTPRFVLLHVEAEETDYGRSFTLAGVFLDRTARALLPPIVARVDVDALRGADPAVLAKHRLVEHLARYLMENPGRTIREVDMDAAIYMVRATCPPAQRWIMAPSRRDFSRGFETHAGDAISYTRYQHLSTPPHEDHWTERQRTQQRLAEPDRGAAGGVRRLSQHPHMPWQGDPDQLAAELRPDVPPPSKEQWAALEAKIDAATPPARKSALDMIQRCAGNGNID